MAVWHAGRISGRDGHLKQQRGDRRWCDVLRVHSWQPSLTHVCHCDRANGEGGALVSSDSADASDSAGGAMDEDDLFAGAMDIDEGGARAQQQPPRRARVDEDMSEVAEIMLNLKVCAGGAPFPVDFLRDCQSSSS